MPRHPALPSLLIALALLGLPASAAADPEGFDDGWQPDPPLDPYSDAYNGSFTDVSARFGPSRVARNDLSGYSFDAGLRTSFPMYVGDFRAAYRVDQLAAADPADQIAIHSFGVSLAVHPFYLFMLGSDWISYIVGSLYIDAGAGAQMGRRLPGPDLRERDLGLFWHFGAGVDVPLWDPDTGQALWLNVLYRNHRADFDTDAGESIALTPHTLFVGLSWRINRLPF